MASIPDTRQTLSARLRGAFAFARREVPRRAGLLRGEMPADAHRPPLRLFLGELVFPLKLALRPFRKTLPIAPAAQPRIVILMPGFGTGPNRMRYMARQLERAGHTVKRWGVGHNFGPTPENFAQIAERVRDVHDDHGEKVALVGWSLGGVFAREVAKVHPDCVDKVISMGSPFSHSPYSNRVWRFYQLVTGRRVTELPLPFDLAAKPPVETIALWSPRDGVVSPRAACGLPEERDRARALRCTHMDFADSNEAISAILRELA